MAIHQNKTTNMRTIVHLLFQQGHIRQSEHGGSIEEYITSTGMNRNGVWGSYVELYTLAHLLQVYIHAFSTVSCSWMRYTPSVFLLNSTTVNSNERSSRAQGIYIQHSINHFEVVKSIV